jgi:hypothetical protein
MPELREHWVIPQAIGDGNSQAAQQRAVAAVLDALIQENIRVPIPVIGAVTKFFPEQAAILIARLPLSESRTTLESWTAGETGNWTGRTLARIASMMLAKDPGPSNVFWNGKYVGFVASVVASSEEVLHISVVSPHSMSGGTATGNCGDSFGTELPLGWPRIYSYRLLEQNSQSSAPIVVDLDDDRIVSFRAKENDGWGSCGGGIEMLSPSTRHRLIAHWLGVNDKQMSWQPVEDFRIVWTGKAAYQRQLGNIVEGQRAKLHATVEALHQRGLLTDREAAMVAPRLIVKVDCEIKPCPLVSASLR